MRIGRSRWLSRSRKSSSSSRLGCACPRRKAANRPANKSWKRYKTLSIRVTHHRTDCSRKKSSAASWTRWMLARRHASWRHAKLMMRSWTWCGGDSTGTLPILKASATRTFFTASGRSPCEVHAFRAKLGFGEQKRHYKSSRGLQTQSTFLATF